MAVASHDMDRIYSRNVSPKQLDASHFGQSAFCANMEPGSVKIDQPVLSGGISPSGIEASESKLNGIAAADWAPKHLGALGKIAIFGNGGNAICVCLLQKKLSSGSLEGTTGRTNAKMGIEKKDKELLLIRCIEGACIHFIFLS